jgi:hypothetical protein
MNEEEANELISQVGSEVDEAVAQWRLQGANNTGVGIHQIFTRELISGGEEGVIPNEANWTGIVGPSGTQTYRLRFRDITGAEYAEPTFLKTSRYDGSFLRRLGGAGELDFAQHVSPSGVISMRVFIADPWGLIGGLNCARVRNLALPYGGRPYLSIPNTGAQFAIFKSATCTRVRYDTVEGVIPIPDSLDGELYTYELYQRSFDEDWMPAAPTYGLISGAPPGPFTYSGIITQLWSTPFTCMGYRTVNIAPEGRPASMARVFITEEDAPTEEQRVFDWSARDFGEYNEKGFDNVLDNQMFDRVGTALAHIPLSGGSFVPLEFSNFECP